MKTLLKSCPFCGSFALTMMRTEDYGSWWVECRDCGIGGPFSEQIDHCDNKRSKNEAIMLWNKRRRTAKEEISLKVRTRPD